MFELTKAQRIIIERMKGYRLVAQFHTGAVLVVHDREYQDARVIDAEGRIYSFSRYLSLLDRFS